MAGPAAFPALPAKDERGTIAVDNRLFIAYNCRTKADVETITGLKYPDTYLREESAVAESLSGNQVWIKPACAFFVRLHTVSCATRVSESFFANRGGTTGRPRPLKKDEVFFYF